MFFLLLYFAQKFLKANSVDPDQMLHFAASDLGLHCLYMSPIGVSCLSVVVLLFYVQGKQLRSCWDSQLT